MYLFSKVPLSNKFVVLWKQTTCPQKVHFTYISSLTVIFLFELVEFLSSIEVDLGKVFVREVGLFDGPVGENVVEAVKAYGVSGCGLRPVLLWVESLNQLAIHEQKQVKSLHVGRNVHLSEVRVEFLQSEVLEDLLTLAHEKATDFLDACLLLEQLSILELGTVLGVVAH